MRKDSIVLNPVFPLYSPLGFLHHPQGGGNRAGLGQIE
jgi:hypothetical protein